MTKKSKKGESAPMKPLTDAQRQLVEDHLSFAMNMGKRYGAIGRIRGVPVEDLQQDACYGLCVAARHYDPSSGADFKTYAYGYCKDYITQALDAESLAEFDNLEMLLAQHERDIDESLDADEMSPGFDIIDEEDTDDDDPVLKVLLLLTALDERERMIVCLAYGLPYDHSTLSDTPRTPKSFREIAAMLHIQPARVRQIYNLALAKMEMAGEW